MRLFRVTLCFDSPWGSDGSPPGTGVLWWVFSRKVYRYHNRPKIERKIKIKRSIRSGSYSQNNPGFPRPPLCMSPEPPIYLTNIKLLPPSHDKTTAQVWEYQSTLGLSQRLPRQYVTRAVVSFIHLLECPLLAWQSKHRRDDTYFFSGLVGENMLGWYLLLFWFGGGEYVEMIPTLFLAW